MLPGTKSGMANTRHPVLLAVVCVETSHLMWTAEDFAEAREKVFLLKAATVKYSWDIEPRVIYCRGKSCTRAKECLGVR